jgi:hypothetical protein
MKKVHIFTSAAFNYIPKARMLFQSLRKHHPECVLHLALADEGHSEVDLSQEPFDSVLPLSELDIPDYRGWAFCHDIVELATAIKPFALLKLLSMPDCEKVLYLDPDTVVFSRLDDVLEALDQANLALTPHQTIPESSIGAVIDNEICSLKHGVFNIGFIGVAASAEGKRFAEWWSQRLYHFCRADICNGLFTDQKWIDLVPAFFDEVAIMRSGRLNLATWNITTREVSGDHETGILVDGEPLGFYHFTGFDSGNHRIMAAKNAKGNATIHALIKWYEQQTRQLSKDPLAKITWAYGSFTNGQKITRAQRIVYRERVDLQAAFPDPFESSGYLSWWDAQGKSEYPDLFEKDRMEVGLANITGVLTPGYRGGKREINWDTTLSLFRTAIHDAETRKKLVKHGWKVLRREGFAGVRQRLSRQ